MTNNTEKVARQSPLKVLLLEKNSTPPAENVLGKTTFPVQIFTVCDKYEFLTSLIQVVPEVILLKDEVPGFSIREAFFLARKTYPSAPVFAIKGGNTIISEAPGPGIPSEINWIYPHNLQGQLSQIRLKKEPDAPEQLAHARIRVVRQIKSNISGLENIRAFLLANQFGANSWMEEVSMEIERSIAYLSQLKENLRSDPHTEVKG
ncbi:MAG: hypothetical protein SF052_04390 [Bacteroidia bacterium]|nr:hypothetical protein [Bacteroidia bacterium]